MLILRRKKNEKIQIGLDIVLTVLEVKKDGSVVLGFDAPKYIGIHREEIYEKIRTDKRQRDKAKERDEAKKTQKQTNGGAG